MVHNFGRFKVTPYVLLHNKTVLKNVLSALTNVGWVRVIVGGCN